MNNFEKLKVLCGFKHYNNIKSEVISILNYIKRIQVPINLTQIITCTRDQDINRRTVQPANDTPEIKQSNISIFFSWMYTFTIFGTLLVNPICKTVSQNVPVVFFSFVPVVHFIYGVVYHSTSHFENWWNDYPEKENYGITSNKLVLSVLGVFVLCCSVLVPRALSKPAEWYIITSVAVGTFIVSISVVEFWFIFYKHLYVIHDFYKKVNKFDSSMNDIVKGLSKIKFDLDTSINAFKNELAVTTLLGGVALGYGILCLNNVNCPDDFPWECVGLFGIHQIALFCIARYLDNRKNEIERISKHPAFIAKYVSRTPTFELSNRYNSDTSMVIIDIIEDNASTLDCQLFYSVLASSWDQFVVLGCGIANGEYIQKGVIIVSIIVILENYVKAT